MTVSIRTPEDVVNAALTKIGFGLRVANMQEGSRQSSAALNIYAQTRDRVLTEGNYRFARQDAVLSAQKTAPAVPGGAGYVTTPWSTAYPPPPWRYEYGWPSDCLRVRSLKLAPDFLPNFTVRPVLYSLNSTYTAYASGTIAWSANPANNDTVTLNGVTITFVTGIPVGNQVQIGANTAFTIAQNLVEQFLDVSSDAALTVATYDSSGGPDAVTMSIVYKSPGPIGQGYTLAADGFGTASGPNLTGGTGGASRTILCNLGPSVLLTYVARITDPNAWDPAFCDDLIGAMAAGLPAALTAQGLLKPMSEDSMIAAGRAAATQD